MRVSVIIPVMDDPRAACVAEAIVAQLPADGELLIVADGARGSLPAISGAKLIELNRANQAGARNRGALEARGEILVFTDADVTIPRAWLTTALEAFEDPSVATLQGGSRATDTGWLGRRIQSQYEAFLGSHREVGYADLCDSRCFAIRRDIFLKFLFDAEEPWCSDAALGRRLWEAGVRTVYLPEWQVGHHYVRSVSAELKRVRRMGEAAGAHWKRTGRDLFRAPGAGEPAGLGGAILGLARSRPPLARLLSRALRSAALFAGILSRLPGPAGFSLFSKACQWTLLAGRLDGGFSQPVRPWRPRSWPLWETRRSPWRTATSSLPGNSPRRVGGRPRLHPRRATRSPCRHPLQLRPPQLLIASDR